MRAYSNDLRRAIVTTYETQGYSQRQVARVFGVSLATVRNYLRRQRQTGSPDALPHAGGRRATLGPRAQARVRQWVQEKNDIPLQVLCERSRGVFKHRLSRSAMCRLLQTLGLRRKKEDLARQ
jgi:transposase